MLPFLKHKNNNAGVIVQKWDDKTGQKDPNEQSDQDGIRAAAADLIKAISRQDEAAVAAALKAAFEILDSEPHNEGEHLNEDENQESE